MKTNQEKSEKCKECHGTGTKLYRSTSTWHGGFGGMALTNDVCDVCWGSGDSRNPGRNLKKEMQKTNG